MEAPFRAPLHAGLLLSLVTVLSLGLVFTLRQAGALQQIELLHHDWIAATSADTSLAQDVVLVVIEEQDLADWGWPLPDAKLAQILNAVQHSEPAVIGLDIYRDTAVGNGEGDLRQAFQETRTIAVSKLGSTGALTIGPPAYVTATGRFGFADIPVDSDGVVRRSLLLVNDGQTLQLSFAFKLAMARLGQDPVKAWPGDPRVMMLGNAPLHPLTPSFGGYRAVDAAGYQVPLTFSHALPVAQMISADDLLQDGDPDSVLREKVVIVGLTSDSIKDHFRTPLNMGASQRFTYGLQVHAAAVQQLLDVAQGRGGLMHSPLAWMDNALVFAGAVLGAALGLFARSGLRLLVLVPGVMVLAGVGLSHGVSQAIWLPAVPTLLAMMVGFLLCFGTIATAARRQRKIMAALFSDHLSPDLARQIWQNRHLFMTGGKPHPQKLQATLIFVDIAGSTAIGGVSDPEAFVNWISHVLDALSDVARAHGGFIEKFTGDGLLVAFGAPVRRSGHDALAADAQAACRCAWAMAERVEQLNEQAGLAPPYKVRIGIHSGDVFGGVLGSRGTLHYNLVGDAVNIASRIEAYGKRLQNRQKANALICMSEKTLNLSQGMVTADPIGTLEHDDGITRLEIFQMTAIDRSHGTGQG